MDQKRQAAAAARPRQFQINRTSFTRHYDIYSTTDGQQQQQQAYYIDISSFTPGKPDLTVYEGKGGPKGTGGGSVVAVVHMPKLSGDFKIGLGGGGGLAGAAGATTRWEDMTKEDVRHSRHRWAMTLGGDGGDESGGGGQRRRRERREFMWKRTRRVAAEGTSVSSLSGRNLKLVEVHGSGGGGGGGSNGEEEGEREEVLAVFTSDRGFSSCGVLQINSDNNEGRDFEVMVVTTCVALYEKARRRRHRAAAGGGGGGGGGGG
ncbi:hypothetical protein JDV02_006562 [Purpureocillium takamizusanense]|uniref:Uncharacterized protein n=1 Tax=Purpureocillium takamizusanense TaxID=2060973 RepID=A0A9Q8VCV8_9HYPO|nr:uncharacterized protein JDV02_006562 [Purpureocillium takamizusanense]UNI20481.1 hypothetical protein JDV02_006562 [Purpureocillium takamizusanense]